MRINIKQVTAAVTIVSILFASSIVLKSQNIEADTASPKIVVGIGMSGINLNSNYGEDNFGINASFRCKFTNDYYSLNVNYIDYKGDTVSKKDYLATLGAFTTFDMFDAKSFLCGLSYCFGVDIGVLYKDNGLYYGSLGINTGFAWNIYNGISAEVIIKTRYNPADKIYTDGMFGLSYQF